MADFKTLDDLGALKGKRVLVRVDLNVPVSDGKVTDRTRIERVAPTVSELSSKGARVVLLAHFGRPKDGPSPELSLRPIAEATAEVLGRPVGFADESVGQNAEAAIAAMQDGDVLLLENTRFHKGEEKNDPIFVSALAELGDLYVNDAFSAAHRAHASTEGKLYGSVGPRDIAEASISTRDEVAGAIGVLPADVPRDAPTSSGGRSFTHNWFVLMTAHA